MKQHKNHKIITRTGRSETGVGQWQKLKSSQQRKVSQRS